MVAAPRLNRPMMLLASLLACPALAFAGGPDPAARPLPKMEPGTPAAKLLPAAPKVDKSPVYVGDDLTLVPEVTFERPLAKTAKGLPTTPQWIKEKGRTVAGAAHLNAKDEDGFLKALIRARPDLAGMPFLMGKDCRADEHRRTALEYTSRMMHRRQDPSFYFTVRNQRAHIAVMGQNLIGHEAALQPRAIRALSSTKQADATKQLARAAVFSPDESLRSKALAALASRPPEESTEVLVSGLRYPWPAVARNAARAIVQLKRKDLIPQLKAVLEESDPRAPRTTKIDGRQVTVANEVVRINHLRNCMLCHAPAEGGKTPEGTLVADIPLPSEPLPESGSYFDEQQKSPSRLADLLVRIDVTYLRQDFSAMGEVAGSVPWPQQQRFDYLVRKRVMTSDEADDLRKRLRGESPFRKSAAQALRELAASESEDESDS